MLKNKSERFCKDCNKIKPISEFGIDHNRKDGRNFYCKECIRKRRVDYKKRCPDKCRETHRKYALKFSITPRGRWVGLKTKNNHKVDFTSDEFVNWFNSQKLVCHYCGRVLTQGGKRKASSLSIDRKNNAIHYTLENIVLSCTSCNAIKSDMFNEKEMLEIAERYIKPKLVI